LSRISPASSASNAIRSAAVRKLPPIPFVEEISSLVVNPFLVESPFVVSYTTVRFEKIVI